MTQPFRTPLLSIITVCLNEPLLERTCESIVNQTFQDFEWIVIDGGSNDKTLAIFEKYKSRMNYFVSESDGGIYFGMNKGIEQATGEWQNFMNAGDMFVHSNILQDIFEDPRQFNGIDVLYGISDMENGRYFIPPKKIDKLFFYAASLPHQSTFIRRKKNLLYDTTLFFCADQVLFISLYTAGASFKYLDKIINIQDPNGTSIRLRSSQLRIAEKKRIKNEYFTEEEQLLAEEKLLGIYQQFAQSKARELAFRKNEEVRS
jgi:glycosyltransferase involved in cell wall biosynthesis